MSRARTRARASLSFFFVIGPSTVAKFVKYYNVKGSVRGQSLAYSFIYFLTYIVARDRAPDLLEQGRRLTDSAHETTARFRKFDKGIERVREIIYP